MCVDDMIENLTGKDEEDWEEDDDDDNEEWEDEDEDTLNFYS
ncbi:MAG TPA: hypothetical protein VMV43_01835 [Candidatus Nanopelagicaceae bacterium]|nr:hypothetical protein [Candidatus Nanopelagicaceae bacterium]